MLSLQSPPEFEDAPFDLANIEAEQALLGALLTYNAAFIYIAELQPQHFYEPLHRDIFSTLSDWFSRGQRADPVTLHTVFGAHPALVDIGGGAYLAKLAAAAITVRDITDYSRLIIDLFQRRALRQACFDAQAMIADLTSGETPAGLALQLSNALLDAIAGSSEPMFQDDYQVTEAILADMKRDVMPYSTGYAKLDLAMGGGLYPGKAYGFAARKKLGKTTLAGSISQNLNREGVRHLFICGEMSPAEIQKRTLARLLRVKQEVFNSKGAKTAAFMQKIADIALASKRAMIYRNAPGLTFDDLKRYVLLARMQKKITGFILDYWQLVGGKPKGKSTAEHGDEVSQWIADTCRKYDLWSITMAQINQEGNTRGGEGIRLAFDQVYILQAPNEDAGRSERWLEMSDTRYTEWRSVGSSTNPGFYLNKLGPYFSETADDQEALEL